MQAAFKLRNGERSQPPSERKHERPYKIWSHGRPGNKDTPLFLYIAYCKGFAKIGITETPKSRLCNMQNGNPFLIEMIYCVQLPRMLAIVGERKVLHALNDAHWFGDWFKASRSHAKFTVESVIHKMKKEGVDTNVDDDTDAPKAPGLKRKVIGPDGHVYNSCAEAADACKISRQGMHVRVSSGVSGWKWADAKDHDG